MLAQYNTVMSQKHEDFPIRRKRDCDCIIHTRKYNYAVCRRPFESGFRRDRAFASALTLYVGMNPFLFPL